jgi:hypothetical protein
VHPEATERRRFCDGFTEAAGSVCRNISAKVLNFMRHHQRKLKVSRRSSTEHLAQST